MPSERYPDPDFRRWYALYPNKKAKKLAYEAWQKCDQFKPDIETMLAILQEQIDHESQWKRGYIPHPSTYLNQCRFEDELTPEPVPLETAFSRNIAATKKYLQKLNPSSSDDEQPFLLGW